MLLWALVSAPCFGQAAAQAIRGTAQGLEDKVAASQQPLTGPIDRTEKLAPGKLDDNIAKELTTTESGLKYRILRKGSDVHPKESDILEFQYKGWLDDNSIFVSTYRTGKPLTMPLRRGLKGWIEGLPQVGVGGMIELEVPYQLGHGERGTPGGPIPPKANLHFIFELISIKK